jgi:hypothetical protein
MPITALLAAIWVLMLVGYFWLTWVLGAPQMWLASAVVWVALAGIPVLVLEAAGALRGLARLLFGRR